MVVVGRHRLAALLAGPGAVGTRPLIVTFLLRDHRRVSSSVPWYCGVSEEKGQRFGADDHSPRNRLIDCTHLSTTAAGASLRLRPLGRRLIGVFAGGGGGGVVRQPAPRCRHRTSLTHWLRTLSGLSRVWQPTWFRFASRGCGGCVWRFVPYTSRAQLHRHSLLSER